MLVNFTCVIKLRPDLEINILVSGMESIKAQ